MAVIDFPRFREKSCAYFDTDPVADIVALCDD